MTKMKRLRRFGALAIFLAAVVTAGRAGATPSLVIDVASGQVLEQDQATASWYPASLTKLMTAYVALDAVRAGRISMDTPLMMSPRACRMAPSKMGFRAGSEVTLHNALIMLMVKSANDIAVAIAEGVSGSVEAFADEMNRASANLGMTQSQWVNPNGLPDSRQVTSARDLAILGRALYLQFPEYAYLFNIGAMQIGGRVHPTHNGLLGRYPGADGMKTGFTCPAGFNLVASATHGGQRLIAVVLGAPSAAARTAKAAALLDRAFQTGSPIGTLASLPSVGPTAAPDMRDKVCRNRGAATAEFMAEVEDMSIPVGSAPTGIPLLDSMGAGTQRISVREIAHLPRPQFTPVQVYAGRAPGYAGPVARARAPGAPIGEQPDLAAYANDSQTPANGEASPISRAAPDATSMRRGKHGKRQSARAVDAPAEKIIQDPANDNAAAEGVAEKSKAKGSTKASTAKTPARSSTKTAAKPAAGKPAADKNAAGNPAAPKDNAAKPKTAGKADAKPAAAKPSAAKTAATKPKPAAQEKTQ
ncbi:serine hydrolase [Methylocystis sp. WRRC1]|uniref:D-alanyl-D-alanine carboxypeptidase family protein n=1 Tax=Methylocystis sp. WRRC1 TaxID=1732014 RepID=UPI001D1533EE|nr:D-alanyl-D-alanine carboxypeptidase family protein [Methylocystis sp. WRRC1]MCC3244666.1 serine hydrolase [Methylocystis sp. WRRC1]